MSELKLVARVDELTTAEGGYLVRSPSVGTVDSVPAVGLFLNQVHHRRPPIGAKQVI